MGLGSESSRASLPSRQQPAPRPSTATKLSGGSTPQQQDALLSMREEWMQAKKSEQAAEHKLRQMAAQLARTEEAAKRILTRTDPSARGGTAAALLEAERQLVGLRAEHAEQAAQLAVARRQATDHKRQAGELKKRLEVATADQRRLALQLGRMQAGGRAAGSALRRPLAPPAPAAGSLAHAAHAGNGGSLSGTAGGVSHGVALRGQGDEAVAAGDMCGKEEALAEAARRFAQQQEQLAAALERGRQLEEQLRQRELTVQQQARQLTALHAQQAADFDSKHSDQGGGRRSAAVETLLCQQATATQLLGRPLNHSGGSSSICAAACDAAETPGCDVQALRVKYLKSKSAVESLAASHTRLLRQLESSRAEAAAADAQHRHQLLQLQAGGLGGPLQQEPELECATSGPSGAQLLHLRQQLAVACHRAERLQIELDASHSRLAVYEAHAAAAASPHQPGQQLWGQPDLPRQQQQQQQPECADVAGLSPHQTIVELHLHAAELQPDLLLPAGGAAGGGDGCSPPFSFLTADFFDCSTQLTQLAEGCRPLYNTTLQFVVGCSPALLSHLANGSVRVELHRCQPDADGGLAADYSTAASADIPLASLLRSTGGASEGPCTYQQATLRSTQGGAPCGTLRYALAALRPIGECQPGASLAHGPPRQQSCLEESSGCFPGGGTQPRVQHSTAQRRTEGGLQGLAVPADDAAQLSSLKMLRVNVLGCRDLLPAAGSPADLATMQPRVSLLMVPDAVAERGNRGAQLPPLPLHDTPCAYETGRASGGTGTQPEWTSECASFAVDGLSAARGECRLQAVVFDDAVKEGGGPEESVIGVAHIHLTPNTTPAAGSTALHPLLHPVSGRHAGLLELGWVWED
ncbi:X-linked retinitis pigmentosa GTPase regulator-interacting protein 1 [Chlorella vulgaris]